MVQCMTWFISGARGSMGQYYSDGWYERSYSNTAGETIEFPIISSFKEGFTPLNTSLRLTVQEKV